MVSGVQPVARAKGTDIYEPNALIAAAQTVLGPEHPVLAAGVFGLQDSYRSIVLRSLINGDGAPGLAVREGRERAAKKQGLTVAMLIAVTADTIHVLDFPATGEPTQQFMEFDRATSKVKVIWFGMSRRVHIQNADGTRKLRLTGSLAAFSVTSAGAKAVLDLIAA